MADTIATHASPAWRHRSNWIIVVDLAQHGMPGRREQLWAHTDDERVFELCCIPYFTYGLALGDLVSWDTESEAVEVVSPSGRRVIRVAFMDRVDAAVAHDGLHGELIGTGCLVEFKGDGYGAIDIETERQAQLVAQLLNPWAEAGRVMWEWASG